MTNEEKGEEKGDRQNNSLTQLKDQGKIMRMGSRKTGYWQTVTQ
jgi:hypothetical protein